ncbi:MAG TPA: indole-3-glycerol phosphate synthase TrpC [Acidimicrobiia bacterium]|nr:indole-3-glycerol phosphate synthase TrpC [Acidimicrobiia bacterium]
MILDEILTTADARAEEARRDIEHFRARSAAAPAQRSLAGALATEGLSVIAEIKRRSPSAGDIDTLLDPVQLALAYEAGGAAAISVLTEPHFFGGSLDDLVAVRGAVSIPVLRKDFTRDPAQVWEARAAGADAVLLIVAALGVGELEACIQAAEEAGVDSLVEAHTLDEVAVAVAAGARIIGVNNRDLRTFTTDLAIAEAVVDAIPDGVVRIAESGVSTIEGARRMAAAGYDAILVGEALVRHGDPAVFVDALRGVS